MRSPIRHLVRVLVFAWHWCPWVKPLSVAPESEKVLGQLTNGHPFYSRPFQYLFYCCASLMSGFYKKQLNERRLGVWCAHHGLIAPPKQIVHSSQYMLQNRPFSKFDYGKQRNQYLYGSDLPPTYDISKITNKFMAFFYSSNDWAVNLKDVEFTKSKLTVPLFYDYLVKDKNWTHFDFQMGNDCGEVVNKRIVEVCQLALDVPDSPSPDSSLEMDYSLINNNEIPIE